MKYFTAFLCVIALVSYSLFGVTKEDITPEFLNDLFEEYYEEDPALKDYIEQFSFEKYDIYLVENRDIYYVDDSHDIVKEFVRKGVFWEVHVFEQLYYNTKPGSIAVDIGGHIGTHTLNLSRFVGKNGAVHVFEPQIKTFAELVINMRLNNVTNVVFHRKALGNEEKWIEMDIGLGDNSVEMKRLDSYDLNNVSVMKIDVEWSEIDVLEGAKKTILANKPVMVVEILGGVFYETATPEQKCEIHKRMKKIEDLGYTVRHLALHDYLCLPKKKRTK